VEHIVRKPDGRGILSMGTNVMICKIFMSCHMLLIEKPKMRQRIKFRPRVPANTALD
jgi:hypothetical protein